MTAAAGDRLARALHGLGDGARRALADGGGDQVARLDALGEVVVDPDRVDAGVGKRAGVALVERRVRTQQRHLAGVDGRDVPGEAHPHRAHDGHESHACVIGNTSGILRSGSTVPTA